MGNKLAIDTRDLVVRRGRVDVLRGIDLAIPEGGIVGLVGPSGCGKTTLMRTIVGVQRITSGTVTVLGRAAGSAALRSEIGYVTQAPSVYDDLTVRQNLDYFRVIVGADRDRTDRAMRTVGMADYADRLVENLSGGQRSRVSLAVALLGDPPLLVLDEPTVGLDPIVRRDLWRTFAELAGGGTTLLVSSHVFDEAEHCDRLLLMRDGAIIADDSPAGLRERTGTDSAEAAFLAIVADNPQEVQS
ncbi:ABC transporter ATP-binding protein [Millisia brevis]|uniref:ABC transporter ATP-binding protein n=1 Tax=Millisia brevis TaxID=264148 RepID=UPI000833797B|nr:ABC transporter ATP-binding protein [Millisia brevis]